MMVYWSCLQSRFQIVTVEEIWLVISFGKTQKNSKAVYMLDIYLDNEMHKKDLQRM